MKKLILTEDATVKKTTGNPSRNFKWEANVRLYRICPERKAVTNIDYIEVVSHGDTKLEAVNAVLRKSMVILERVNYLGEEV